jgi:hypothetical protein
VLADGETFYFSGSRQIVVTGVVGGPAADIANWVVVLQGVQAPLLSP